MDSEAEIMVGCSGFSYDHWKESSEAGDRFAPPSKFFPADLHKTSWLRFYSHRLATVEINSSFYGFPKPETLRKWQSVVAPGFSIVMKCPKSITHEKRLEAAKGAPQELLRFIHLCVENLQSSLGAILVQLPPSLARSDAKLRAIFDALRACDDMTGAGHARLLAFEFRHASWDCDEVRTLVGDMGACVVQTITPEDNALKPNFSLSKLSPAELGSFAYIRCGHSVKMEKDIGVTIYGACEAAGKTESTAIKAVAQEVRKHLLDKKRCFVFMMNDLGCWAPEDAMLVSHRIEDVCSVEENFFKELQLKRENFADRGLAWRRMSKEDALARCRVSKSSSSPKRRRPWSEGSKVTEPERKITSFFSKGPPSPSTSTLTSKKNKSAMDRLREQQKTYFS